jgi:mannose-6-phosphate isomerase-like protein (cupin superfamily)
MIIEKPWGSEEMLERNNFYVVKKLFMKKGHRCSLQYHQYKTETIYVVSGILKIHIDGIDKDYYPNEFVTIYPEQKHRMTAVEESFYLESSTTQLDDVVRIEDDYNRIN